MSPILYELAGEDEARRFSPYCWRTRMALAHKGLEAECRPVRFTEKEKIARSGQKLVPVLVDGDRWVSDSWVIACHLEDAYPERPSLFGGAIGLAEARFINFWADQTVLPGIFRLIMPELFEVLAEKDKDYFRETRERRFGVTLEEFSADRDRRLEGFRKSLQPARATLKEQPFLAGAGAAYADHILFGPFQWARCTSPYRLLDPGDPVHAWRERMLDLYGGMARAAVGFPC